MAQLTYEQALSKAAHLCSTAEKAPQEIFDKLITWGISSDAAEEIVCKLKEEKYLDEARYAHAFVHDKFNYEHWGKMKIAYNLRNKGISDSLISNTLDDVISDDEYVSVLADSLKSKMRGMSIPLSQNDKAKLYRFAAQRGFESRYVSIALNALKISDDEF